MKKNRKNINQLNYNKVKYIVREGLKNISADVTFKHVDGSKQTLSLKKESLVTENKGKISAKQYMSNLNGIKHDINAGSYSINIIK